MKQHKKRHYISLKAQQRGPSESPASYHSSSLKSPKMASYNPLREKSGQPKGKLWAKEMINDENGQIDQPAAVRTG